jgi:hypothetical protein
MLDKSKLRNSIAKRSENKLPLLAAKKEAWRFERENLKVISPFEAGAVLGYEPHIQRIQNHS